MPLEHNTVEGEGPYHLLAPKGCDATAFERLRPRQDSQVLQVVRTAAVSGIVTAQ